MSSDRVGRYEIKSQIARGGMAIVYLAWDPRFRRDVAVKILSVQLNNDPSFRARFEREAQTIAAMEHPAIVPVYDFGEEDQQLYLVMRHMTGGSLSDRLKTGGRLSISQAAEVFSRLAPALDAVHLHSIIHRDLKPGNILFDQYGNSFLADFGIARLSEATTTLTGEAIIGTPSYMSPEQVRGDSDIDGRSDVYALGAILFEMLTARQPYEATTPMGIALKHLTDPVPRILQYRADLPAETEALISRAMAKDRTRRFTTAGEMARALEEIDRRTQAGTQEKIPARTVVDHTPEAPAKVPLPATTAGPPKHAAAVPRAAASAGAQAYPAPASVQKSKPASGALRHPPRPARRTGPSNKLFAAGGILTIAGVCGVVSLLLVGSYLFKNFVPGNQPAPPSPAIPSPDALDLGTLLTTTTDLKPASAITEPRITPTLGLSAFKDDFSNPESGWYRGKLGSSLADYANGNYRISVEEPNAFLWSTPDLNFADVIIEVETTKVAGADENYFGVICRVQDTDNFYVLIISSSGFYTIGKYKGGEYSSVGMDGWEYSNSIHQGKTTNRIRAECVKDQLILTVNQIKLTRVTDSDFRSGDVGLIAAALNIAGTNILFDNFSAQSP